MNTVQKSSLDDYSNNFEYLAKNAENEARKTFFLIKKLIVTGVFVVIFTPYLIIGVDFLFKRFIGQAPSTQEIKNKIISLENEIDTILDGFLPIAWIPCDLGTNMNSIISPLFTSEGIGIATDISGKILVSEDNGKTWRVNYSAGSIYQAINITEKGVGIITTYQGDIIISSDGGRNWQKTNISNIGTLSKPVKVNENTYLITSINGHILISDNGGLSWKETLKYNTALNKPAISESGVILITSKFSGSYLRSTDAGNSWENFLLKKDTQLKEAVFSPKGEVVVITNEGHLFVSNDEGLSWIEQDYSPGYYHRDIVFSKSGVGVVSGTSNTILQSLDFGLTWHKYKVSNSNKIELLSPVFNLSGVGVITGESGELFISIDDGKTWKQVDTSTRERLNPPVFSAKGTGVITGYDGTLLTSTDNGRTWSNLRLDYEKYYASVRATFGNTQQLGMPVISNNGLGIIVGHGGKILVSFDHGVSWSMQNIYTHKGLNDASFNNEGDAVITGQSGICLKSNSILNFVESKDLKGLIENAAATSYSEEIELLSSYIVADEALKSAMALQEKIETKSDDKIIEKYAVRATLLGVILFLIQILVNNYRYQMKLSTFYLAKSHAMKLYFYLNDEEKNSIDINILMSTLTPSADFGKQSISSIDTLTSAAKGK